MSQIPFSIIIPTRDRHDTLQYSIQTILEQTYPEFELIIMDNFSSPETAEVTHSFNDNRIKYYRAPERLSMSENWELGLSKATGQYISILGDDDGFLPDALEIANQWINTYQPTIVSWNRSFYWWPSCPLPWRQNVLRINADSVVGFVKSEQLLPLIYQSQLTFEYLPMLYNSLVHRDIIDNIKSIYGKYFLHHIPDVYSGVINAYLAQEFMYSYRSLSICGTSGHSTGFSHSHQSLAPENFQKFINEEKKNFCAELHPRLVPSQNLYLTIADAYLCTKDIFFPERQDIDINIKNLIQQIATWINVDSGRYEQTLQDITNLANKYNIPLDTITIPAKEEQERERPQGFVFNEETKTLTSIIINCEQADISNIRQAVKLAQGILPPPKVIQVLTKNRSQKLPKINLPTADPKFFNQIIGCLNLYKIDPTDEKIIGELRTHRAQLVQIWLNTPPELLQNHYQTELGQIHQKFNHSPFKNEPLTASEKKQAGLLLAQINQELNQAKSIVYFIAGSLYLSSENLPILPNLPSWLIID